MQQTLARPSIPTPTIAFHFPGHSRRERLARAGVMMFEKRACVEGGGGGQNACVLEPLRVVVMRVRGRLRDSQVEGQAKSNVAGLMLQIAMSVYYDQIRIGRHDMLPCILAPYVSQAPADILHTNTYVPRLTDLLHRQLQWGLSSTS